MARSKMKMAAFLTAGILAVSLWAVYALAGSVPNPVPDTGQTQSYTNTFGEDSDYTINPHSYTNLGDMVKDNVTGLIWQKATAGPMNWEDAKSYCENLTLGGYTDWRLPTVKELSFIVNRGRYNPAIDTNYFPNTISSDYWSSTAFICSDINYAWYVYFDDGFVSHNNKSFPYYVRAVRNGQ